MEGVFFFAFIILCVLCIISACIRHARRSRELRELRRRHESADFVAFRRQQQAARQAENAQFLASRAPHPDARTAAILSSLNTTQPSAPTEVSTDETRKEQINHHLFHRKLEHADSARELCDILAAANDRSNDAGDSDENIIVKTWRSAETSVNKLMTPTRPECSICLDGYEANETVCWAKNDDCDHIFHAKCITEWLASHDECPLCRTNLLEYEGMQNASNV